MKTHIAQKQTLYEEVADKVAGLIHGGTLRTGDRIPSIRRLSRQLSVSVSTVLEAYRLLEDRGLIEARPQSGYYVRLRPQTPPEPDKTAGGENAATLDMSDLVMRVLDEANRPEVVGFGTAVPDSQFLPVHKLNRILAREVRRHPGASQAYDTVPGYEPLRVQIARRLMEAGVSVSPAEIITTTGTQEALQICLRAVTKPGDIVAIETPTYFGLLQALESLHLRALEISTDPREGICLEDLAKAVGNRSVAACVLVPNFANPLGHLMPEAKKRELMTLLDGHDLPLIEDDVYGDLFYEGSRPKSVKAYDRQGRVLYCSSFSKTLAPGYRIGWTVPGRYRHAVARLKYSSTVATTTPTQMAVAAFLESGGYDRHLRRLRRTYRELRDRMTSVVAEHFPPGTSVTRPEGGHVLWVGMPPEVDALSLYEDALRTGIGIAPGPIFSARLRYRNFLRLNVAVPWSDRVHAALETLGRLAAGQMETVPAP